MIHASQSFLLIQIRRSRRCFGRFARQRPGDADFMRTAIVLLEVGKRHVVGIEKLELVEFRTDQKYGGAFAARTVGKARDQFVFHKTALQVHIHLKRRIANLANGQRGNEFEILARDVGNVAELENIVFENGTARIPGGRHRHVVEARANGVGQRHADEQFFIIQEIGPDGRVKNFLAFRQSFKHVVVFVHQRVGQQRCVGAAVQEFRGKTQTDARFLDAKTESVVELKFQGLDIADFFRKNTAAEGEFIAERTAVHDGKIGRLAGKTRPRAAGVSDEFVLVLETGVAGVHKDGEYLVLSVDRLFLGESSDGNDAEYEGKKCLFHRNRKFGRNDDIIVERSVLVFGCFSVLVFWCLSV